MAHPVGRTNQLFVKSIMLPVVKTTSKSFDLGEEFYTICSEFLKCQRAVMERRIYEAVVKKLEPSYSSNFIPTETTVKYDDYDENYVLIQSTPLTWPKCEKIVDVDVTSFTPSDDIGSIGDNFEINLVNGEDTENIDFIFGENHLSRVNFNYDEYDTEIGVINNNDRYYYHDVKIDIDVFDKNGRASNLIQGQHEYQNIGDNRSQNLIYDLHKT